MVNTRERTPLRGDGKEQKEEVLGKEQPEERAEPYAKKIKNIILC